MSSLFSFLIFFKVAADCELGCVAGKLWFSCTFVGIAFHQFSKSIFIKTWRASWLRFVSCCIGQMIKSLSQTIFVSQWRTAISNLSKLLSDVVVNNDTLAVKTTIILITSVPFFLFLNSFNITCQTCTFSSLILGAWDHSLNYDTHSFTTKIRMTEGNLLKSNFRLHLKHWRFEMHNSNLHLKNENYSWLNQLFQFSCYY